MCSILYQVSGKCNTNLNGNSAYSNKYSGEIDEEAIAMYQSTSQFLNEATVCSYIDSLRYNTYDESGEVILSQKWGGNSWAKEMRIQGEAMRPGLKAGLWITGLAALSMAVAALALHGLLARKNIPWFPKREKSEDPTDIARQNSGILMGRSRSGPGTTPLI